jgi:hypothetical protein
MTGQSVSTYVAMSISCSARAISVTSIGAARRERDEQEASNRDAGAGRAAWHQNHRIPLVSEAIALGDTGDLRAVGSLG